MAVLEINDSNFKEYISSSKKVVVDCYAPWCGPCKMMSPIIDELAEEESEVSFYKVNIDDNDEIVNEFGIMSIPTLLFFENSAIIPGASSNAFSSHTIFFNDIVWICPHLQS